MNTNTLKLLAGGCIILTALIVIAVDPWAYRSFNALKQMLFVTGTGLLITGFVFAVIIRKKKSLVLSVIELVILIRLIWLIVAHPDPGSYIQTTSFWLLISLLVFTMVCRQLYNYTPGYSREELQSMFLQMVAGLSFFQAFAGIFQFYMIEPGDDLKTTVLGTLGAANGYGLLLSIGLLAHLGLLLQAKTRIKRLFLVSSMFFILSVLFLNGSRGAMLSLAVSLVLFLYIRFQKKACQVWLTKRMFKKWQPINLKSFKKVFAGSVLVLLLILSGYLYRVDIESSQGRWMVWQLSATMLIEHPLTGIGHGNYATEYLNYQARWFQNEKHQPFAYKAANLKQAHNEFLQAFFEGGTPGGLLFLYLWLYPLFHFWKNRSKLNQTNTTLFAILAAIVCHSLMDSPLHVLPVTIIAYFILGISPLSVIHFRSDKFISKFAMSLISVGFFFCHFQICDGIPRTMALEKRNGCCRIHFMAKSNRALPACT
ncbi:MAG TPA: O-antigen ligase family protein [Balneolaceae bacterium]|nr:O-antigen ligase family protein [Balneolaceae bacterium]